MNITAGERRGIIGLAIVLLLILGGAMLLVECRRMNGHAPLPLPEAASVSDSTDLKVDSIPSDSTRESAWKGSNSSVKGVQKGKSSAKKTRKPVDPRSSPHENPTPVK